MKKKLSLLLTAVVLILALLPACTRKSAEKYSAHSFDYFDTVTTITGYAASQAEFDRISGDVLARLGEYHKLYTIYHRFQGMENLCTVNELLNGAHRTVTVDRRIIDLLLYAKEMYEKTDGKVNIADAFVIRLYDWGYYSIPADRLSLLDMNRDGVVNTADAHILFACLAGAIEMPIYE